MKYYLRYGDDFILIHPDLQKLKGMQAKVTEFLECVLSLKINPKANRLLKTGHGLKFLGVMIYLGHRKLTARNLSRIKKRISHKNLNSYYGLILQHGNLKLLREFHWMIGDLPDIENE